MDQPTPEQQDAQFDLILLDPTSVKLFRTGGSVVRMTLSDPRLGEERSYLRVTIARAFPFSDPDRYIGLRDGKDRDIGMLQSLNGLDVDSRRVAEEELYRRYFLPKIQSVRKVTEEFGITTWEVDTDKGSHTFVVRNLRDAVLTLSPTRVLVTDITGTRWEFPDINTLGDQTVMLLQRVL